jgi:hypothetical protein
MSSTNFNAFFTALEAQVGREALVASMAAYLASGAPSTPPKAAAKAPAEAPAAPKKAKKEKEPGAPKKEPNAWILFTTRVRSVLAPLAEEGKKLSPKAVTQTASVLKEAGLMGSATDEQIVSAYQTWLLNPPAVSKQEKAGKNKRAKGADDSSSSSSSSGTAKKLAFDAESEAESEAPSVAAGGSDAPKKRRGPKKLTEMTEEERAAHDAKKAAKKAAKAAGGGGAAAAPPALPPSPKMAAADPMEFEPFVWKKLNLLKNARGDVLDEEFAWFGHWDEKSGKMDVAAAQPEDLEL